MLRVSEMKDRIDELAGLMDEFKLSEAELSGEGFRISFKKRCKPVAASSAVATDVEPFDDLEAYEPADTLPIETKPTGTPITSPMTGIYYAAPSPSSPPYVSDGETISAGQVIGLIEAMKVFNEVPAPTSGTVIRIVAESGQLVNLGDPLMYVG
jgi:acetyl-CoA carboxylase biotin carboxyl carrier protein